MVPENNLGLKSVTDNIGIVHLHTDVYPLVDMKDLSLGDVICFPTQLHRKENQHLPYVKIPNVEYMTMTFVKKEDMGDYYHCIFARPYVSWDKESETFETKAESVLFIVDKIKGNASHSYRLVRKA